jgi:hypothetical protein
LKLDATLPIVRNPHGPTTESKITIEGGRASGEPRHESWRFQIPNVRCQNHTNRVFSAISVICDEKSEMLDTNILV